MFFYFKYFLITITAALIFTPIIRRVALRLHVLAQPNHRTMHDGMIPKLGGGAILLAFIVGIIAAEFLNPNLFVGFSSMLYSLLLGVVVLFVMGAFDDKVDLDCNLKIIVELVVATIAVMSGWRVDTLVISAMLEVNLGILAYPLSVLWIVGLINAINMIDGLDGLASGIALFVSVISLAVAALYGNTVMGFLSVLLIGAIAGFLRYNLNPASIFLGDSGSLALGFILACITMGASAIAPGKYVIIVPLLLMGIPITDTTLAIIRRIRRGIHPFHADREHIHHRLVRLGLSHSGAAMFMVGMSLILGILAYLVAHGVYTDVELLSTMTHM